jgi:hypothetical protein
MGEGMARKCLTDHILYDVKIVFSEHAPSTSKSAFPLIHTIPARSCGQRLDVSGPTPPSMPRGAWVRKILASLVLFLVLQGCAATAIAAHAGDLGTTAYALDRGYIEQNPVFGEAPAMLALAAAKGGFLALSWLATQVAPEHKGLIWTLSTVVGAVPVVLNVWTVTR